MGAEEKAGCAGFGPDVPGLRRAVQGTGAMPELTCLELFTWRDKNLHQLQWHRVMA